MNRLAIAWTAATSTPVALYSTWTLLALALLDSPSRSLLLCLRRSPAHLPSAGERAYMRRRRPLLPSPLKYQPHLPSCWRLFFFLVCQNLEDVNLICKTLEMLLECPAINVSSRRQEFDWNMHVKNIPYMLKEPAGRLYVVRAVLFAFACPIYLLLFNFTGRGLARTVAGLCCKLPSINVFFKVVGRFRVPKLN